MKGQSETSVSSHPAVDSLTQLVARVVANEIKRRVTNAQRKVAQ